MVSQAPDSEMSLEDIINRGQPVDTNMEILPGKKVKEKAPGGDEEAKEKMSKRKKRKLEQLAKKRESQELRADVLKELRSVRLTPEQAALLHASQSTTKSRRQQVEVARQRLALGVPLTDDMKKLRRRRPKAVGDDADASDDDDASAEGGAVGAPAVGSAALAAPAQAAPAAAASSFAKPRSAEAPQPAPVGVMAASEIASRPAPRRDHSDDEDENGLWRRSAPVLSPQPLVRETIQRLEAIEEQRSKLPAVMMEQEMVEMALSTDVLLVCGETGCGKSTQVPQFLFEAGLCQGGRHLIGVTQPRRVAAISVSQRVEEELNRPGTVGYQVRYDKSHCSKDTRIKFMTDGILLREVQADFLCKKYTVIVIDEAHERGVNCDILIGLLSRAVQRRRRDFEAAVAAGLFKDGVAVAGDKPLPPPPLKLVIMSATLRLCDFTENKKLFPTPPPVMRIEARTFPVTVHFGRRTEEDYIKAAHRSVRQIHRQLPPGTVLVFVTGRHEVHRLCRLLNQRAPTRPAEGEGSADEEGSEDEHQLEASDEDGGDDFDDDLPEAAKSDAPAAAPAEAKKGRKRRRGAAAAGGEQGEEQGGQQPEAAPDAKGRPRRKKRKGAKAAAAAAADDAGAAPGAPLGAGVAAVAAPPAGTTDDQELGDDQCDVNFRIDAEEDVVVLDPEAEKASAEDAKDIEARRQKRLNMARLDKSRTANGVFKGCGFGEGPIRALPLYAQLPARAQLKPFGAPPEGQRIVVVSTNVAETSVTLPNVRYVVDCGHEKRRKYRPSSGVSSFVIDRISKASADQRAGRAGRLGPGHTYRLYSAAAYENHFAQFAPIPILHTPMDPVLLLIAFLGVPRLDVFPWPTPPLPEAVIAAMHRLRALGAIADDGTPVASARTAAVKCTRLGFRLAVLPLAPRYGKILLTAIAASEGMDDHIIGHACGIVAALSVGNLTCWETIAGGPDDVADEPSAGMSELARVQIEARARLLEAQRKEAPRWSLLRDDAEGLLWLMGGYSWAVQAGEEAAEQFCQANRVNHRQISEAHSLMQQLGELLKRRLALESIGTKLELPIRLKPPTSAQSLKLRECITSGLIDHVAVACPDLGNHAYICADLGPERAVFIHTSSNVYRRRPRPSVLVFNEIISTAKPCMRDCVAVDQLSLAKRACAGDSSLVQMGDFLPVPAPRYLPEQDRVMAFCSPTYAPLAFKLPTIEVSVPADMIFRYKVFAKALLEGEVLAGFPPRGARLQAQPSIVMHAPTNPRVQAVVQPLWAARVGSREELRQRWAVDSRFLLPGVLKWLPASLHDSVSIAWPPVGKGPKR